jgi:pimeloyl-ACP methyl ester carboxylesterase
MSDAAVWGIRETVRSSDGVAIGTVTAGQGPQLLLVHGGMRSAAGWAPLWPLLVDRYRVTAMDRRGRGTSGDAPGYSAHQEYDDVAAVAEHLGRVDVLAHSIGAVFALGAAARGAPIRRLVLCEPPGPPTLSRAWWEHELTHAVPRLTAATVHAHPA